MDVIQLSSNDLIVLRQKTNKNQIIKSASSFISRNVSSSFISRNVSSRRDCNERVYLLFYLPQFREEWEIT